jgi:hypothetical protein
MGGEGKKTKHKLCLILSLPCFVGHKPQAIVAAIEKMADSVPRGLDTFEDVLGFLTSLRDGTDSPDVFYLGQIPGFEGRFAARLDSLHTIQMPGEAEQEAFRIAKRIGHLHPDFVRDLHTRIFRAFATLGFDDECWMSTQDLHWLVSRGRTEQAQAQANAEAARTALTAADAQGYRNANEKQKLEAELAKAQADLARIQAVVQPYEVEQQRRQTPLPME